MSGEDTDRTPHTQEWERATDPSSLTTSALQREVATLKEQLRNELAGEIKVLVARIDAIDKATTVFSENLNRVPTAVDRAIGELRVLVDEKFVRMEVKFTGVQTQMTERDVKVSEVAVSTGRAIDAALSAAEKATSKQAESFSEAADKQAAAFTKSIDQQAALYQTETRALRDICNTLDRRLTAIEAMNLGGQSVRGEQHQSSAFAVSVIAVVLAFIAIVASILIHFMAK